MANTSVPIKINGFSRGVSWQQILSYVILIAKICFFAIIITKNFILAARAILSLFYFFATGMVIVFGFLATIIDPTDRIVIEQRKCELAGKVFDDSKYPWLCEHCKTSVHEDSKHCRICNRCVSNFDHHCNWINNCVSDKNYRAFLYAIICLAISTFIFALSGILFTIDYFTYNIGIIDNEVLLDRSASIGLWEPIIISIFSGIAVIFLGLDIRLITFHYHLNKEGLTTYEYIVQQREIREGRAVDKSKKKISKSKKNTKQIIPDPTPPQMSSNNSSNNQGKHNNAIMDEENPTYKKDSSEIYKRGNGTDRSHKADSQRALATIHVEKNHIDTKESKEEADGIKLQNAHTGVEYDLPEPIEHRQKIKSKSNLPSKPPKDLRIRNDYHLEHKREDRLSPMGSNTHLKGSNFASFDSPLTVSRFTNDKGSEATPGRSEIHLLTGSKEEKVFLRSLSDRKESSADDLEGRMSVLSSNVNLLDAVIKNRDLRGDETPSKASDA